MAVSEPQRLALYDAARRTLGEEEADTLMALSPPANTDIATRQDIDVLRSELLAVVERVTRRSMQWMVGVMVVLHGATVGLLTLTLG